jgi:hypothetical protein
MNATVAGRHVWQPSERERFVYRGAVLILIVALVFMVRLLTWLAFPGEGFRDVTITAPNAVQAGTLLRYTVNYCHGSGKASQPVLVMRELELQDHGTNIQLPGLAYTTTADCETKNRTVGIPVYTPPGPYKLRITTELQANPIRHVRQEWLSPSFMVIQ